MLIAPACCLARLCDRVDAIVQPLSTLPRSSVDYAVVAILLYARVTDRAFAPPHAASADPVDALARRSAALDLSPGHLAYNRCDPMDITQPSDRMFHRGRQPSLPALWSRHHGGIGVGEPHTSGCLRFEEASPLRPPRTSHRAAPFDRRHFVRPLVARLHRK